MLNRRALLRTAGAALAAPALFATARAQQPKPEAGGFTLPKLPYAFDALEPSIDAETMTIHYTKHHQGYTNNLNAAVAKVPAIQGKSIEAILGDLKSVPEASRAAVRNNGGGYWNHSFFWNCMAPTGKGGQPKGDLLKAIEESFKSVDEFKAAFAAAAGSRFGSGWAWLIPGKEKPLAVDSSPNQDNTLMVGGPTPLLGLDVWEHAYYLKYRNLRPKYVAEWWKVVNWDAVAANFAASKKK